MTIDRGTTLGGPRALVSLGKSDNPYTLRMATENDAEAVACLIGTVWSTHFAYSVTPQDLANFLSTSLSPAQISADIQDPSMRFLLSTVPALSGGEDEIVGVAQLVIGTREDCLTLPEPIELRRLYVADAHHGTGLAKSLVNGAIHLARGEGYRSMWLGAWEDNARGIRFYEKMGFRTVGEHTFLVGQSVRKDWVMEKRL